jgi:DNA-binding MarR family transcriptional regulator
MAMRPHVKDLEEANLVISSVLDDDQRRKHIALTSRGWLVHYQRSGYVTAQA